MNYKIMNDTRLREILCGNIIKMEKLIEASIYRYPDVYANYVGGLDRQHRKQITDAVAKILLSSPDLREPYLSPETKPLGVLSNINVAVRLLENGGQSTVDLNALKVLDFLITTFADYFSESIARTDPEKLSDLQNDRKQGVEFLIS